MSHLAANPMNIVLVNSRDTSSLRSEKIQKAKKICPFNWLCLRINIYESHFAWSYHICCKSNPGGGALNFFSGRGCAARISEVWGLRTDICLWKGGLVSGKCPNLGACERKMSKFGGLWAKIWVKIEAVETKISKFSQKGALLTDSFAWNGTLASGRRGVKRGSSGPHIPIPSF